MTARSLVTTKPGGTSGRFTWTEDTSPGPLVVDYTADMADAEPQAGDGGNFNVTKQSFDGGIINRPLDNYFAPYFHNYVADAVRGRQADLCSSLYTNSPDGFTVASQVMARTNPSRPVVDCTIAAVELRDFPDLFKRAGESLLAKQRKYRNAHAAQDYAETTLQYYFGWAPLVRDFVNVMYFGDLVDQRVAELTKLKQKGIRRRCQIGEYTAESNFNMYLQSVYRTIIGQMQKKTTERVWGFITWTPNQDFPDNAAGMRRLARDAVGGLLVDPSTAWELIPFSWLVDWCFNIGQFFAAHRNIVPATPSLVQVMRHKRTTCTSQSVNDPSDHLTMTPVNCFSESKQRATSPALISAHLQFLNERQMSILGSVGLLKSGENRINTRLGR